MKHMYKACLLLSALPLLCLLTDASMGPGTSFSSGYTGASFDAGNCSNCHGGGSYTPSVNIQLLSGTTPVSSYIPNASYTLNINISTTTGSNPAFGFQVVAVRSVNSANAGSWGTLTSSNHQTVAINGRTYVEHNTPLASGSINIPWIAPSAGNGSVVFYASGNVVNEDNSSSGDNPQSTSLTIPVSPLPATWLSFDGIFEKGAVALNWSVTSEMSTGVFLLEKSKDGQSYEELVSIPAKSGSDDQVDYHYTDKQPLATNYYRIRHKSVSGEESTFKTIKVQGAPAHGGVSYVSGHNIFVRLTSDERRLARLDILGVDGRLISSRPLSLQQGANIVTADKPEIAGVYLVVLRAGDRVLFKDRFLSE